MFSTAFSVAGAWKSFECVARTGTAAATALHMAHRLALRAAGKDGGEELLVGPVDKPRRTIQRSRPIQIKLAVLLFLPIVLVAAEILDTDRLALSWVASATWKLADIPFAVWLVLALPLLKQFLVRHCRLIERDLADLDA